MICLSIVYMRFESTSEFILQHITRSTTHVSSKTHTKWRIQHAPILLILLILPTLENTKFPTYVTNTFNSHICEDHLNSTQITVHKFTAKNSINFSHFFFRFDSCFCCFFLPLIRIQSHWGLLLLLLDFSSHNLTECKPSTRHIDNVLLGHYMIPNIRVDAIQKNISKKSFIPSFVRTSMGVPSIKRDFRFYWKLIAVLQSYFIEYELKWSFIRVSLTSSSLLKCDSLTSKNYKFNNITIDKRFSEWNWNFTKSIFINGDIV